MSGPSRRKKKTEFLEPQIYAVCWEYVKLVKLPQQWERKMLLHLRYLWSGWGNTRQW